MPDKYITDGKDDGAKWRKIPIYAVIKTAQKLSRKWHDQKAWKILLSWMRVKNYHYFIPHIRFSSSQVAPFTSVLLTLNNWLPISARKLHSLIKRPIQQKLFLANSWWHCNSNSIPFHIHVSPVLLFRPDLYFASAPQRPYVAMYVRLIKSCKWVVNSWSEATSVFSSNTICC